MIMEKFANILGPFTLLLLAIFVILCIAQIVHKHTLPKAYLCGAAISFALMLLCVTLSIAFESPETKAEREATRVAQQTLPEETSTTPLTELDTETPEETEGNELTKEERLLDEITNVINEERLETFNYVPENDFALIRFKGSENLSGRLTVKGMYLHIAMILAAIQNDIDVDVDINVTYPLTNKYGNVTEAIVIKATFHNETIKKINFDAFDHANIPIVADEWWNHNALNIS